MQLKPVVVSAESELKRRDQMWQSLVAHGGPHSVAAGMLRELGIYGGMQGVWVDKEHTGGVTVGMLHTGRTYADDLTEEGVVYHYPVTGRPSGRDAGEVEATKRAGELGLPVFVITHGANGTRDVHLGQVEDWDDASA